MKRFEDSILSMHRPAASSDTCPISPVTANGLDTASK